MTDMYDLEYKKLKRGLKVTWGPAHDRQVAKLSFSAWRALKEKRRAYYVPRAHLCGYGLSSQVAFVERGWMEGRVADVKDQWGVQTRKEIVLTDLGLAISNSMPDLPKDEDLPGPTPSQVRNKTKLPKVTDACWKLLKDSRQWSRTGWAVPVGGTKPEESGWASSHRCVRQMRTLHANGYVEPGMTNLTWVPEEGRCIQKIPGDLPEVVWRKTPMAVLAGY